MPAMNEREANHESDIEPSIERTPMTEVDRQPVPVATAPNELTAHLLQHVLETEGIESFVFGSNTKIIMFWSAFAQVRVEVHRADYERARKVLEAFRDRIDASLPEQRRHGHCVVCGHDRANLETDAHCPKCGSQASVWKVNEGQFEIAAPPDARSSAVAAFFGYAVWVVLAVLLAIGAADLMGLI
jgi:rubrerythrin